MHMVKYCVKSIITNKYAYGMCTKQFLIQLNLLFKMQYLNHYMFYTYLSDHLHINNLQLFSHPNSKMSTHTVTFINFGISKQVTPEY